MTVIVPTLRHERRLWNEGLTRVVGVDEVGVAPTCGAVVAAAVIMKPGCHRIPGVRDSKTLSMAQRERLAPIIRKRAVAIGVGAASVREIDQLNIYHATHLAMRRAIARIGGHEHVIVDGNRIVGFEAQVGPYSNVVDGDAKVYSIACASIVAKVVRDRMMTKLAARYPGYGWEHNQGYATRDHRDAIRALGLTPFHRRSFLRSSARWPATSSTSICSAIRRRRRRPTSCWSTNSCRSWSTMRRSTRATWCARVIARLTHCRAPPRARGSVGYAAVCGRRATIMRRHGRLDRLPPRPDRRPAGR